MGTEKELQQLCLETLREHYHDTDRMQVDSQVPIIKDCTFVPDGNRDGFTLYFGHTKGDIVLYRQLEQAEDEFRESEFFKPWWRNGEKTLNIPYAVIEVKRGEAASTGAIRSKSEDARELRSIFPFVGYFFVADEAAIQPHKFYRANKRFDGAFLRKEKPATMEWVKKKVIRNGIEPHLTQLKDVGVL